MLFGLKILSPQEIVWAETKQLLIIGASALVFSNGSNIFEKKNQLKQALMIISAIGLGSVTESSDQRTHNLIFRHHVISSGGETFYTQEGVNVARNN